MPSLNGLPTSSISTSNAFVNFAPVSVVNVNGFSVACTRNLITFVKAYGQCIKILIYMCFGCLSGSYFLQNFITQVPLMKQAQHLV